MSSQHQPPQRPIKSMSLGHVSGAVWAHPTERNGRRGLRYSFRPQNRYYDGDTQRWVETAYYSFADILHLAVVAIATFAYVAVRTWWGTDDDTQQDPGDAEGTEGQSPTAFP